MRRDHSVSSPAPTSTFFGSHPRRAQVPPYGSSSMTATCQPAARHLCAGGDPASPVPMTTRSNCFFIRCFDFRSVLSVYLGWFGGCGSIHGSIWQRVAVREPLFL